MYLGNVVGPLIGSGVSALMGFRWVFVVTAVLVLINCLQLRSQFNKVEAKSSPSGQEGER
ncbi:drug efflux system protein MdtG [compost metagenome]|jgi:DHA1 family multidrug resistance protein-like MFS transporter